MREQFLESGHFLLGQWKKFLIVLGLFLALSVGTAVIMAGQPEQAEQIIQTMQESMSHVIDEEGNIRLFELFINNLSVAGLGVIFGFVPFICFPLYVVLTNSVVMGVMFGYYAAIASQLPFSPWKLMTVGILPHGIFELGAIFMSIALGLDLCMKVSKKILGRGEKSLKEELTDVGWAFVLWIVPLLLLAAVIECYLTPMLMNQFL